MATVIREEIVEFRARIPAELLARWEKPAFAWSLFYLLHDWLLILVPYYIYITFPSPLVFLLAIIPTTIGQRGLSNLAHDAAHRNISRSRQLNDWLSDLFLAAPFLTTTTLMRKYHAAHHQYLGTEKDPDHGPGNESALKHCRHPPSPPKRTLLGLYLYDLLSPSFYLRWVIGSLPHPLPVLWWLLAALLAGRCEGTLLGWRFVLLFHLARCSLGYLVFVAREVVDHAGLPEGGVAVKTRTAPRGWVYAHDDHLHVLHHLLPRVPMARLAEVDRWFRGNVEGYREGWERWWGREGVWAVEVVGRGVSRGG